MIVWACFCTFSKILLPADGISNVPSLAPNAIPPETPEVIKKFSPTQSVFDSGSVPAARGHIPTLCIFLCWCVCWYRVALIALLLCHRIPVISTPTHRHTSSITSFSTSTHDALSRRHYVQHPTFSAAAQMMPRMLLPPPVPVDWSFLWSSSSIISQRREPIRPVNVVVAGVVVVVALCQYRISK